MNKFISFFTRKRTTLKVIDTNVSASKINDSVVDTNQYDKWDVDIPDLTTPLFEQTKKKPLFSSKQSLVSSRESLFDPSLLSPTKKRMSLFSSKDSLMSSQESLSNNSNTSGVAYRRHPDDRGSRFGRLDIFGTSTACYGRYSMIEIDEVLAIDEEAKEISLSLTSLERIESIQKRAFDIARNRRKFQRNRENKKRPLSDDDYESRGVKVQSMIELSSEQMDGDILSVELCPIVARKSSMLKKSWEIRLERKRKMKKRR